MVVTIPKKKIKAMFAQGSKLAVLESKLTMYEELSREMLSKLENAVDKISEGNSAIANILTKHDERIEQTFKTDELIIKMITDFKGESKKESDNLWKKIEKLEEKIENIVKFRWIVAGGVLVISFALSQSSIIVDILTPDQTPVTIERLK